MLDIIVILIVVALIVIIAILIISTILVNIAILTFVLPSPSITVIVPVSNSPKLLLCPYLRHSVYKYHHHNSSHRHQHEDPHHPFSLQDKMDFNQCG